jgi:hypothetical protein
MEDLWGSKEHRDKETYPIDRAFQRGARDRVRQLAVLTAPEGNISANKRTSTVLAENAIAVTCAALGPLAEGNLPEIRAGSTGRCNTI